MAKKEKTPKAKGKGRFKKILFLLILLAIAPKALPTFLLCVGLLPTLVAWMFSSKDDRYELAAIGYLNLAGVLPFILDLWEKGQRMEEAMRIAHEPYTWVIMFGAAGLGWLIMFALPPFVAAFTATTHESRLRTLQEARQELEKIWGPKVGSDESMASILQSHNS
ncbi:MAG: hypothetical protein FWF24_06825 [Alphaproteobacteria bacterium]|nr:hypothetical protein [Alphaproteobacteria bacterium]